MGKRSIVLAVALGALAIFVGGLALGAGTSQAPSVSPNQVDNDTMSVQVPGIGVYGCEPAGSAQCGPG